MAGENEPSTQDPISNVHNGNSIISYCHVSVI